MGISTDGLEWFFLTFVRVASMLVVMPVFGSRSVPRPVKVGTAFFLTFVTFPLIRTSGRPPGELVPFFGMVLREATLGLVVGFVSGMFFYGVELSGQVVGIQMGFGVVNVIDPQANVQVPLIGQFQQLLAGVLFLSLDGHHILLEALAESFRRVPLGGWSLSMGTAEGAVRMGGMVFALAFKFSAPIIAALLLSKVALGILARTVPQMNVFIVGLPLTIGIGLLGLALSLPFFGYVFGKAIAQLSRDLGALLKGIF
ncbi:MAG TPA: flagellar type III secretion system protein FliR [Candidatus Latescibacteria bacterium]|nr:flagellar type III secretion system protein FliR [Candidatus Latescibacterota bacterium]